MLTVGGLVFSSDPRMEVVLEVLDVHYFVSHFLAVTSLKIGHNVIDSCLLKPIRILYGGGRGWILNITFS